MADCDPCAVWKLREIIRLPRQLVERLDQKRRWPGQRAVTGQ
jgi:hypothetical protein